MSARPKPKVVNVSPPMTLAELEVQQGEIEHQVLLAERAGAQARQDLATARKMLDAEAIALARQQIRKAAADAADLQDALADARAAVEAAKARNHAMFERNRLETLLKLADDMVAKSEALEAATVSWAATRNAAITAATEYETELARCAITFDAFLSVATRLDSRVELALYLETDGKFGRARTLDTPEQIRQSRRASLALAATEFRTLTLRGTRAQLGISEA